MWWQHNTQSSTKSGLRYKLLLFHKYINNLRSLLHKKLPMSTAQVSLMTTNSSNLNVPQTVKGFPVYVRTLLATGRDIPFIAHDSKYGTFSEHWDNFPKRLFLQMNHGVT